MTTPRTRVWNQVAVYGSRHVSPRLWSRINGLLFWGTKGGDVLRAVGRVL
jgi:hypothetical protein